MAFVLDASMTMSWCFADENTPYSRRVLDLLLDSYGEVPALWSFEVANVLAVNEKRQRLTKRARSNSCKSSPASIFASTDHFPQWMARFCCPWCGAMA
jgi:predicted nucleic acid-binding protein